MGFESIQEYNEIMFLREITHTVNALNDMGDIVRLYSKNPEMCIRGSPYAFPCVISFSLMLRMLTRAKLRERKSSNKMCIRDRSNKSG